MAVLLVLATLAVIQQIGMFLYVSVKNVSHIDGSCTFLGSLGSATTNRVVYIYIPVKMHTTAMAVLLALAPWAVPQLLLLFLLMLL